MKKTISARLFNTLQKGKKRLGKEALRKITSFVESQLTEDGAFKNKSGEADLYYTMFGWTLACVLGIKMDSQKMNAYLEKQDVDSLDFIHFAAYTRCKMISVLFHLRKANLLVRMLLRGKMNLVVDFAGETNSEKKSPYMQYIALSMIEDTMHSVPDEQAMLDFIEQYHLPNGGYRNTQDGLTATTNATVAALAVKGQLLGYKKNNDLLYLRNSQGETGGFSAAAASPVPDLLSTATSLFMLNCYGVKPKYPSRDFVEAHWLDSGGFAATLLDDESDVEYTFYGLLALGASRAV